LSTGLQNATEDEENGANDDCDSATNFISGRASGHRIEEATSCEKRHDSTTVSISKSYLTSLTVLTLDRHLVR